MHQLLFSKSSQVGLEKWTGCYWKVSALFTSLFFQRDYRYIPYDLDNLLCLNVFFLQIGLLLLVGELLPICLVHHILLSFGQVLLSYLEWYLWMYLLIHVLMVHLAVLVVIALPLLSALVQHLLHTKAAPVQLKWDLLMWEPTPLCIKFGCCIQFLVCSGCNCHQNAFRLSCSVILGIIYILLMFTGWHLQAKCVDFALAILYIILVSLFFGWGFFHRKRERSRSFRMKPLVNAMDGSELHSVERQKEENLPMQVQVHADFHSF